MKFYVCWVIFSIFLEFGYIICQQNGFGYIPTKPMSHEELLRAIPGYTVITFLERIYFKKIC